ncbi:MAG: cation-translocating P-type ATPase [Microbacteriaceae bacterium]|nr:cation-translocating P-type ATPase [Microbacteriaceae bacterium]
MSNDLELDIEGMTCTACARRVEKSLNKLPGVSAYVDFATETAHLTYTGQQASEEPNLDELKTAVEATGYKIGEGKSEQKSIKPKLITGAILSVFTVAISMIPAFRFVGWEWVALVLSTPVMFYVAYPFHEATIKNLRFGTTTMDTLISLGSLVAYLYSVFNLFFGDPEQVYFEVAAVVPTVVLLGRYIELGARRSATDSVKALLSAIPETSIVIREGARIEIATSEIRIGDHVVIPAGQTIPVDGIVIDGNATVDNSAITGESLPEEITTGSVVSGGGLNLNGSLVIEASSNSAGSRLGRIADLVREATSQKTKVAGLTDRISAVFVPAVIVIAIVTYLVWAFGFSNSELAFQAAVAVLVIACPCALGIAVPMSLVVSAGNGAKRGIVIRNPDSLTELSKIKQIVLDKTGTLTYGKLAVHEVIEIASNKAEILAKAAAVEKLSAHPIAKAIADLDHSLNATEGEETAGFGISGIVNGTRVTVSKNTEVTNSEELQKVIDSIQAKSLVVVAWDGIAQGVITLTDTVRDSAIEAIAELKSQNIEPIIVSGDNQAQVDSVAAQVGISRAYGDVSPEDKQSTVKELSAEKKTAMVGDGLNDVAALAGADVGIAMGSGTRAAQSAAAITILDDNPLSVPYAMRLAKRTWANIVQNLGWAFGYNILLIPVASLGLLNPMLAGAAMGFSSISVVLNSWRLKR